MPLLNYRCDNCHSVGFCTKEYYIANLPEVLIIQLIIFKFTHGRMKKIIPTLHIDEEISIFGNTMNLHGIIYHEGEQANSGHYTSRVKVNDRWFLISDSNVMNQDELSCALIGTTSKKVSK